MTYVPLLTYQSYENMYVFNRRMCWKSSPRENFMDPPALSQLGIYLCFSNSFSPAYTSSSAESTNMLFLMKEAQVVGLWQNLKGNKLQTVLRSAQNSQESNLQQGFLS